MHITVLGATGATGSHLVRHALDRGHAVTAVARDPTRLTVAGDHGRLTRIAADVRDPASIAAALRGATTVISGLGVTGGDQTGVLTAGARAAVAAYPDRIIWMGAFGTGASADAAGAPTRTLLRAFMRSELSDKVTADTIVLEAGGAVFHCGPLSGGPLSGTRHTLPLSRAPRRLFPARVSRATVAAAMLDAAEAPHFARGTFIPVNR